MITGLWLDEGEARKAAEVEHGWAGPQSTSEREQARQRAIAQDSW
jgi:hypothetical protein